MLPSGHLSHVGSCQMVMLCMPARPGWLRCSWARQLVLDGLVVSSGHLTYSGHVSSACKSLTMSYLMSISGVYVLPRSSKAPFLISWSIYVLYIVMLSDSDAVYFYVLFNTFVHYLPYLPVLVG